MNGVQRLAVWTGNDEHNRKIQGIYEMLKENWVEGGKSPNLPYPYLVSAREGYRHDWLLDTSFNAVAWAPFDAKRAKETFRNHWYWIDHHPLYPPGSPGHGMIPGVVVTDHSANYYTFTYTQIPVVARGVWEVYCQTGDREFLQEAYPYLVKFHSWLARERDVDGDLLMELGSYSGQIQFARFEGADFNPSLDRMIVTNRLGQLADRRWYGNVELVERTSVMVDLEKALGEIADLLGDQARANELRAVAKRREQAMDAVMWDEREGFYFDVDRDTHKPGKVKSIWNLMPLFSRSCSRSQAAKLVAHLTDPDEFWTPFPVATCARSEPVYRPDGFWRGDCWVQSNFFIARGLRNYGYHELARKLTDTTFLMMDEKTCSEHHDSRTGKDLGAKGASFNSWLLMMMYESYYGIQADYRTIVITDDDWGKHITLGNLEAEYALDGQGTEGHGADRGGTKGRGPGGRGTDGRGANGRDIGATSPRSGEIRLRSGFERDLIVVSPDSWKGATPIVKAVSGGEEATVAAEILEYAGAGQGLDGKPAIMFKARPGTRYSVYLPDRGRGR